MRRNLKLTLTLTAAAAIAAVIAAAAFGAMRSQRVDGDLCKTTGGGRFVDIPGFPGERIDRRLLSDIEYLESRYKIFITDGYSNDPVHAGNGEHPIGLALDIVPNKAIGGSWKDVSRLARWAEPTQDQPRLPFRWVGYNGDAGHGRGNHLHLSWDHSDTDPGTTARTVYTMRCPGDDGGGGGGGDTTGGGGGDEPASTGGVSPGKTGKTGGGGVSARRAKTQLRRDAQRHPVSESGGVGWH